jgi:hypothetical protein
VAAKRNPGGRKPAGGRAGGGRVARTVHPRDEVKLGRRNWIAFGIALLVIVVGYVFLANGSITIAPILLVLGYCVLVPYAILARDNPPKES